MFCTDIPAPFLWIFSSSPPQLLYYSHIPTALVALLLGLFVYYNNRKDLASKLLLFIAAMFILWSFSDLILWANVDSRRIMFFWAFINILEMSVTLATLYFAYAFLEKKDAPFNLKIFFSLLLAIFIILIPTTLNLSYFDITNCEAQQGKLIYYFYFLEGLFILWLLAYLIKKIFTTKRERKREVIYFSIGIILFSASFSGANIAGSIAALINPDNEDNWKILQYGLFGMPVFMAFLSYLIVKYKAFDIKLVAANALVAGLIIIVGSELFFADNTTNQILILISLALSIGFGYMLVKSVQLEIKRKEQLQEMTDKLAIANDQLRKLDNAKSEFISIASHQLRTPLTAVKGFISLLLEGSYGKMTRKQEDVLNKVYTSNERLVDLVEDLLNLSRIESGRMEYTFAPVKMEDVLREIYDTFIIRAKDNKLYLDLKLPENPLPEISTDKNKIREIISNLVDNALKYTPKGGVTVRLTGDEEKMTVAVSDTGIGVPKDELPYLFAKFSRGKDTLRLNTGGTGLGLHVGQRMIEELHGKIWVESAGKDKGSTFFVELPVKHEA